MSNHPPAHLLQRIANDPSPDAFAASFGNLRYEINRYLSLCGFAFSSFSSILDLGCGVGRFLYAMKPELGPRQRIWGCDVWKECALWCQDNIDWATVLYTNVEPPLPFPDRQFDFVYALSVFTHLRLDLQFRWAWELHRVLRKGGVGFITVSGPSHFPILNEVVRAGHTPVAEMHTFGDDSLYYYVDHSGADCGQGQVDIAVAHTPGFAREVFSPFEIIKRFPRSNMAGGQDLYLLQKTGNNSCHSLSPASDAEYTPSEVVVRDKLALNGQGGLRLMTRLDGQRCFKVYPSVEPAGFYPVECKAVIKADQQILAETSHAFNEMRVFGGSHHGVLELSLPPHTGNATVELRSTAQDSGLRPRDVTTKWCYPVLY